MYKMLFEPIRIGKLKLKNRIVLAPMVTHFATKEGAVTKKLNNYYAERARGGVGLIVVECASVTYEGRGGAYVRREGGSNRLSIYNDGLISGLKKLTQIVHKNDSKIALELYHAGPQVAPQINWEYPVSASSIPCHKIGATPRTLTVEEVEDLVEKFAEGARRTEDAGFDAIQIHAAHGYLIWSFLSPLANKRRDKYGGDPNSRMRFLLEIIERIREKIGEMPLMIRMNGNDYLRGGITLKDAKITARRLEEMGVDALNISAGTYDSHEWQVPPYGIAPAGNVHLSAAIKKVVKIPVSIAGAINSPDLAERILREGKADFIDLGRALIADSEFPRKVATGKIDDIKPCIRDNRCLESLSLGSELECTVNAFLGKEGEYKVEPAVEPKKVLVVGAGPAGLEAACVAALRGHEVILYEKDKKLGGQWRLAFIPPYKEEIGDLIKYYENQIKKLGIRVKLGKKVTPNLIEKMKPQVVIVATGATPLIPKIPGTGLDNVITAHDVLAGKKTVGKKVVIMGGGLVGLETADYLSDKGKKVTVVEQLENVGMNIIVNKGKLLFKRLSEKGVRILLNTNVEQITKGSVIVIRLGKRERIEIDNVVLASGAQANRTLMTTLKGRVPELYAIGDCVEPREAFDAIQEGLLASLKI